MIMLLTGCSLIPKEHRSVKTHEIQEQEQLPEAVQVTDYESLKDAILKFIKVGREEGVIRAENYNGNVEEDLVQAAYEAVRMDPIGAYAVDYLNHTCSKIVNYYEINLSIIYRRTAYEIASIQQGYSADQLTLQVQSALQNWESHLALRVKEDQEYDIAAIVQQYCLAHPEKMVEIPELTITVYPETGQERVVAVDFAYTHTRAQLEQMRKDVEESVAAAAEYIRYRNSDRDKVQLLYTYLTQRFTYTEGSSATPAYSALCEGVADPLGLAQGFTMILDRAGVICHTVPGLLDGEEYHWNIVSDDGDYRHADLSRCILSGGGLWLQTDWEMSRYYWDSRNYPACVVIEAPREEPPEEAPPAEEEPTEQPEEEDLLPEQTQQEESV